MKRISRYFLVASWIIYFATGRGVVGSTFLILSGLFFMTDLIPEKEDDKDEG